ncbi:MAG TPA: MFS transporter [Bacteroidales bacterium]|jgi:MFS family permease|nr:MFS transporter [Bacteroidales bacterium]
MKNKQVPPGYLFSRRYTNYIFILLFLLYMFDYIDRMVVTSLLPFLKVEWSLTDAQSGALMSAVYLSISLLSFPVAILIDRWSRRKTIGIMAVVWGLATGLCALTKNFGHLLTARTLIGVGEAGYAPGGTAMIAGLYPQEKRSWMIGLWNASIPLGSAIGVALGGVIASIWGWRHAFGLVAIPGLLIAILFFFVKDYKTVVLTKSKSPEPKPGKDVGISMSIRDMFNELLNKPSLIFTYFGIAGVVFTTTSLLTWLPTYFHRTQGLPEGQAGMKSSLVLLLALVGAPLGGYVADKWRKKKINARLLFPTISTLLSALILFLALVVFPGKLQYALLLVLGVLITAFVSAASSVTQDVVHPGMRAMSYAVAVAIQNSLGSMASPVLIGALSDATNIQTALSVLPLALLLAAVMFFTGSFYYERDLSKVVKIDLEVTE